MKIEERKSKSPIRKMWEYFRLSGPGYLQSAITLGSGTASACLIGGGKYGYTLLWVQPLAMLTGVIMFSAIARQTLYTGERPYKVFWENLHPAWAALWAWSALIATVLWHFPQYALASSVVKMWIDMAGFSISPWVIGIVMLALAIAISWSYAIGAKGIKVYEMAMKSMVWTILLALLLVIIKTGVDWGELAKGFLVPRIPRDPKALTVVLGTIGATVGINMVFLYPYSLLKKGWGPEYKGFAYLDLWMSMFLPFVVATSLLIIATANTIYGKGIELKGALEASYVLEPLIGTSMAKVVMGIGLFSMAFSTITLHMLASGFITCEIFGLPMFGWPYRLSMLVPCIGVIGVVSKAPLWLATLVSSFCLLLMPAVYIGFMILHNSRDYMGENVPVGRNAVIWNAFMSISVAAITAAAIARLPELWRLFSSLLPG